MSRHRYAICNVFTSQRFGGNPLAVVLDARGIDDATLQAIARDFNLSETSFVLPPSDPRHAARVRIFTPGGELPFAGHPTIGTAFVLATLGIIDAARDNIVFEEGVGPIPVRIERDVSRNKVISCTLTAARIPQRVNASLNVSEAAALLGLGAADIASEPQAWSCGVPFMIVPLTSVGALASAALDIERWSTALESSEAHMVYPVAHVDAYAWSVRMFAPKLNVAEDPATGAATAAFAGWLAQHERVGTGTRRYQLRQGEAIGRPSVLELEFDCAAGSVSAVRVGGSAVFVAEGELRL